MRKLIAKDIAPFTKIISKMNLKDSIKAMFGKSDAEKGEMVTELIWGIIQNYHLAENELHMFLADLEGKTKEEIANLELDDFIALITGLFSEKNMSFFKLAAK